MHAASREQARASLTDRITDERVSEDRCAGPSDSGERVEDPALLPHLTRQAMQDSAEGDRIEGPDAGEWLAHISDVDFRLISIQPGCGILEAVGLQIDQCEPGPAGAEVASVQEIAGTDPDVRVIRRDVTTVVGEEDIGR